MKLTIALLAMQLIFQGSTSGQPHISSEDSDNIKMQIEGFYSWYINKIKTGKLNADFNPKFVKRNDGMTTLNFDNYKNGLMRFKFSDDFIQTKINDYQQCVDNLAKIPFDKFSKFEDFG
ncbi:MAG: hypothetical protein JNM78_15420 [Cyclobacteriaceae bacterium]|nr:hypothetical protein [Cyclobacteriaceae bacterium]